jgi:uncharacterized protein YegL
MAHLTHNEQVKLTAAYLNALAIGSMALGVLTPLSEGTNLNGIDLCFWGWIALSAALHLLARLVLKRLREWTRSQ